MCEGDLMTALKLGGRFDDERVWKVAKGMVGALEYLHCEQRIIHRDLKLQNILLGDDGEPKICDFGFSNKVTDENLVMKSVKGTPIYMAPEIIEERPYNHKVDIWALGIILYELHSGQPPFFTTNIFTLIELILNSPLSFPKDMKQDLSEFIGALLQKNPENRIDWPDLGVHPYLSTPRRVEEVEEEARPDSGIDMMGKPTIEDGLKLPPVVHQSSQRPRSVPFTVEREARNNVAASLPVLNISKQQPATDSPDKNIQSTSKEVPTSPPTLKPLTLQILVDSNARRSSIPHPPPKIPQSRHHQPTS
ncbi:kinase-like domain-containing protein [Chytridium lagenaria]|nr:kinase-like domain-containing protein [Chytridium lagenaria]